MKKIISLVLTLAIAMMSMVILPVSVSAASALPLTDDFSGSDIDFEKWNSSSASNLSLESGVAKISGANVMALGFVLDEAVSTGSINIKYDYLFPETNSTTGKLWLYGGNGTGDADSITNQGPTVMTFTYTGGKSVNVPKRGVWYTVDLTLNCDTKEISASVTSKETGDVFENTVTSSAPNLVPVKQIHFGTKDMGADEYILIDNISITQPVTVVHELPVEDDFSDNNIDFVKWNGANSANVTLENGAAKLIGSNTAAFGVKLDKEISTDAIKIKYDYYMPSTNSGSAKMWMYGGSAHGDNHSIANQSKTTLTFTYTGGKSIADLSADTWYTVEMIIDCETKKIFTVVTSKATGAMYTKNVTSTANALVPVKQIYFGTKDMNGTDYILLDNISITKTEPVSWNLPISDDFNGTSFDFIKWNGASSANVSLESGSAKLTGSKEDSLGVKLDETISTGAIKIKYDYYIPSSNSDSAKMWIYGGSGTGDNHSIANHGKTALTFTYTGGQQIANLKTDNWYTVETTLDCDTKKIFTIVTSKADGSVYTKSATSTANALVPVKQIYFGTKDMNSSDYILLDNISITKAEPISWELPISDNFDGESFDFAKWNLAESKHVALADGGVKVYGGWMNDKGFGVKLDEAVSSGKVSIKYDLYLPSVNITNFEFRITAGSAIGDKNVLLNTNENGMNLRGGYVFAKPLPDTWYTVEYIYNCETLETVVKLTPRDGGATETYTGTMKEDTDVKSSSQFYFGTKWMGDDANPGGDFEYVLVDNVTISRYFDPVEIAGVKFVKYDDTIVSNEITNISAGTKEIVVTFNTPMDKDTLNDATVTLVNTKTNQAVSYTGTYNDTDLTWHIPLADYLAPSVTYALSLTEGVKNGGGVAASPATWEFATDAGEYKAVLSAYKGSTKVTKLEELATGDEITVKAEVINTTGMPQNIQLIYAGYNSNELIAYKGFGTTIGAEDRKITVDDLKVTIDKTNMTHIRLFGWYDYKTLKTLSDSETIQ